MKCNSCKEEHSKLTQFEEKVFLCKKCFSNEVSRIDRENNSCGSDEGFGCQGCCDYNPEM